MLWLSDFPKSCATLSLVDSFAGDSPEVYEFISAREML